MKWAVELGEYNLQYKPRTAINEQVMVDFIADLTPNRELQKKNDVDNVTSQNSPDPELWTIYIDRSSNQQGCREEVVILSPLEMYRNCIEIWV